MKILVLGGAGYLGSVLVPLLLWRGHRVTVLDSFLYGENSLALCCSHSDCELVVGDVRDKLTVRRLLAGADAVVPLAAIVGAPACARDPLGSESVNVTAMRWLFEEVGHGQLVVMPTTNSQYGTGGVEPLTEDSPVNPLSEYARQKVEVENALLNNVPLGVSLRFATLFGMSPRMRLDLLVNDFVHRAVTDHSLVLFEGGHRRNFLHVRDAALAILHVVRHPLDVVGHLIGALGSSVYNVGDSRANLTKRQLCEEIQRQVPNFMWTEAAVARDPDQRDYVVSNARFEDVGWAPTVTLQAGIAELVKGCAGLRARRYSNV